jgi:hypothetical protein
MKFYLLNTNGKYIIEYKQKLQGYEQQSLKEMTIAQKLYVFLTSQCPEGWRWNDKLNGCTFIPDQIPDAVPCPERVKKPSLVSVQVLGIVVQCSVMVSLLIYAINPKKGKSIIQKWINGGSIIKKVAKIFLQNIDTLLYVYSIYLIYTLYTKYQKTSHIGSVNFVRVNLGKVLLLLVLPTITGFVAKLN